MGKKTTFIFVYRSLRMGGVEKNLIDQLQALTQKGARIIWLKTGDKESFEGWQDFISRNITTVRAVAERGVYRHDSFALSEDESVTAVAYTPESYLLCERLKQEYPQIPIASFYILPHFTGKRYFPEEYFFKPIRKTVYRRLRSIFEALDREEHILFFAPRHIRALEEHYGIKVSSYSDKLLKPIFSTPPFDLELAKKRAERDEFRLISVGRFEFPHKGYLLGLIRAYAQLKPQYPKLKLEIVGSGEGGSEVLNAIEELPVEIAADITLTGTVKPEELKDHFDCAHLNVSVAGGVVNGAQSGLVSLGARHYCYDCEVYGYLPESRTHMLSDEPGDDVKRFITDLIETDDERYMTLCKASYDTYAVSPEECSPDFLTERHDPHTTGRMNERDYRYLKRMYRLRGIESVLKDKIKNIFRMNHDDK